MDKKMTDNSQSSTPSSHTEDDIERVRSKFAMATCFEFRMRAHSFDLHTLGSGTKLAKLGRKLFRSRSDTNVKSPSPSPAASPGSSPSQPPRRRFMRVVRDGRSAGQEYENPHIIRKYTQQYVETRSLSLEVGNGELPYTVTGHTILKKHSSFEEAEDSPPMSKHASFKEEVEIIEFDKKQRLEKGRYTRREKLHDSDSEYDSMSECGPIEESEEEGDCDKENELPLDPPVVVNGIPEVPAEDTVAPSTAKDSETSTVVKTKETCPKCDKLNTNINSSVNNNEPSPPCSPTSGPEKVIPLKKTRFNQNVSSEVQEAEKVISGEEAKSQITPKETPRIESLAPLISES